MKQEEELELPESKEENDIIDDLLLKLLNNNDVIELYNNLPEAIYHYTSPSGLRGIISSNSIWFTHYKFLNDRSEKFYTFLMLKTCLEEKKDKLKKNFYQAVMNCICDEGYFSQNIFYEKISKFPDYYIASFSLNPDSLNMWNYYTKQISKTGYSLEFNLSELRKSLQNKSYNAYKVNYDKEKLIKEINHYIKYFNEVWDDNRSKEFLNCLCLLLIEIIDAESLQNKHQAFSSEEEFRIVFKFDDRNYEKIKNENLMRFREMDGIMIPFLDIGFDKKCVKGTRISPAQHDELAKEGLRMMLDNSGYEHIVNDKITISDIPLRY